ncbi:phosphoenolpyruvate--protein phosphotransferase [Stackebrandtia nassauensis]|uniref:Phosphoenolpyruvate-protein phosphotransferase n=1 Tax=Stackebrandtia nassauensis (strain DSM 44728 / CIP 108903 / NRRL B-16338 / NBRC 102104 / LLR-40K-21) TaxID=446470 RepID=D3Q1X4_STANL|nr:phosphoenolpyruvate--protein phosphotransferase [Stackebrandtia nassauensis]ADD41841.1 phosphoenolpyruvate-protein phosphotransferase [Stackebrandtia nassauensis DSM 44728]
MSETLRGIGVSPGLAAGPVRKLAPPPRLPAPAPVTDTDAEKARAAEALAAVARTLRARAAATTGAGADILNAEAMIVEDPMLAEAITTNIGNGADAPHAIDAAIAVHREAFQAAGGFLAERVSDLDDLRNRAVAHCLGQPSPGIPDPGHPFILVAADLAPADTAGLDTSMVLALVTETGGPTSHTAILARAAGLPAVVGCPNVLDLDDDTLISVDGTEGTVTTAVDDAEVARVVAAEQSRRQAEATATGPGRTSDGHRVALLANIGSAADLPSDGDYEGVGLFRTELLYLDRTTAPTLTEQNTAYREVFEAMGDRPIVVRTLDAGADKPLPFLSQTGEPNPALGVRGLRLARQQPNILDTQLSAIAEAASDTGADVRVMAPMVSTVAEASDFAARARWAGLEKVGVMVEVPAIALLAEDLVEVVDFLSIGSNDLSQYLFAADRQSSAMPDLLDPAQPALLRLIARCAEAGAASGTPVGVCGEAAARPDLAVVLTGLGVTSLSMSARALAAVRHALSRHTMDECRDLAGAALSGALVKD